MKYTSIETRLAFTLDSPVCGATIHGVMEEKAGWVKGSFLFHLVLLLSI